MTRPILLCLFASSLLGAAAGAADTRAILPGNFTLSGPAARQTLLLERGDGKHFTGQVTNEITFSSSDEKIVKLENGAALPVANGVATLTARQGNQTATVEVKVAGLEKSFDWSFRNHVQPVLAKAG